MIPLSGEVTCVQVPPPPRRVSISDDYHWCVDGRQVPATELGRQFIKAAYEDDVDAGYPMDECFLREAPKSLCGVNPLEEMNEQ